MAKSSSPAADARLAFLKTAERCFDRWAAANLDVVRSLSRVSGEVLQKSYITETHLPGVTTLEIEARREQQNAKIVAAYADLQTARRPLLHAFSDLTASLDSLCDSVDREANKILTLMQQQKQPSSSSDAISATLNSSKLDYALRSSDKARQLCGQLLSMYRTQLAMTQAAIVSVLPQSCEDEWRAHCAESIAKLINERASLSGSTVADGLGEGTEEDVIAAADIKAAIEAHAAAHAGGPFYGLTPAGESNHAHLTALAASMSVLSYIDLAQREALMSALEFIAGCAFS